MTNELHIMVGLPGSGKSTFVKTFKKDHPDTFVYSTDDYIEGLAQLYGITYDQAWCPENMTEARHVLDKALKHSNWHKNVIIDMTNLSSKSRAKWIEMFKPQDYKIIANVFDTPANTCKKRMKNADRNGKTIPEHVFNGMVKSFQKPTYSEGFDEINEM